MDREDTRREPEEILTPRYRNWLLVQARNLCRNADDAEDFVQEALERFMRNFRNRPLPCERARSAWLTRTLTNLFFSQCRKRGVHDRASQDPHFGEEAVETSEFDSPLASDAVTPELFAQAVRALSPTLRETFELHSKGWSYQQLARHHGLQVGTIAKRLHDARASLREYLLKHLQRGED